MQSFRRAPLPLLCLLLPLVLARESAAQSAAPSAERAAPLCQSNNALSAIACELRAGLPAELADVAVVAGPVAGLDSAEASSLSQRLAEVVAGRFDAAESATAASLAAARARATKQHLLFYLTPQVKEGHFEVAADLFTVPRGFWDRFKAPPGPLHHVFASRRLDGEIGSFLPVPKLIGSVEHKASAPTDTVAALECADLDGDRALELVVVGRQEIYSGRIRQGRLATAQHVSWQALSPIASTPLRQAIASAKLQPGQGLNVGLSDRANMVRLGPQLELLASTAGKQPWGSLGCAERRGLGLNPAVVDCEGSRTWERLDAAAELDTIAGGTFEGPAGSVRVLAGRNIADQRLYLLDSDGRQALLPESGAQVAVADLNLDGVLEVVSSKNTLNRNEDALRVHAWRPAGLELIYEIPVPSGIDSVTTCPAEDAGAGFVVIATKAELWLIR